MKLKFGFVMFVFFLIVMGVYAAKSLMFKLKFQPLAQDVILEVKENTKKYDLSVHNIRLTKDNDISFIMNSKTVLISSTRDIESQLASLQKLFKSDTMKGEKISVIDLRFNMMIVK